MPALERVGARGDEESGSRRESGDPPKKSGWSIAKMSVLILLLVQNTVYTLLRRYSQANLAEAYNPQEVLLVGEFLKLVFSGCVVARDRAKEEAGSVRSRFAYLTVNSGKMFGLAMIYGAMNVLGFVAIRRVDAAVFTVCAQLKILTTASFSVALLGKRVSSLQWRSLVQLVLGCILVTVPQLSPDTKTRDASFLVGLAAVLTEVCLSGFASIYFEKVIKASDEKATIWERNYQLAMHSILLYLTSTYVERLIYGDAAADPTPYRPFHDFSNVAWMLAFLSAFGGLLVALTVKVADSVVKTLAVSVAVVTSTLASHYLLGGLLTLGMSIGALTVALSVANYSFDPTPR